MKYQIIFVLILTFLYGCSTSKEVQSSFSSNIAVNGIADEWGTNLKYEDDQKAAFGFANNTEFLYLVLVTSDRNTSRKILMNGLTIRLESSEGTIGIKYPMPLDPVEMRQMRMQQTENPNMQRQGLMDLLKGREDLQVVNEEDLPLYTFKADAGEQFRGMIKLEDDKMVYELQVPLKGNDITGRVFKNNISEIEINFNTNEINREEMRGPGRGMGEDGPPRRQRSGGGGMRQPMGERDFSPLSYSFNVILKK